MRKSESEMRRALSAADAEEQAAHWHNSGAAANNLVTMKPLLLFAAALSAPLLAAPGGEIDTLQLGNYHCELPGDVASTVGAAVPAEDFSIINASSYVAAGQHGTYLLTDDMVTMTSGPKNGQRFRRQSNSFLRKLGPDGNDTRLRCVRQTGN